MYRRTYDKWSEWYFLHDLAELALTPTNVNAFFESQDVTKATSQRQLTVLRKLVELLSILDYTNPKWAALHGALKKVK